MGSTVAVGGMEISSNHESAQEMVKALKPIKEDKAEPKVVVDEGKPVDQPEAEPDPLSKAAAELGRKGGEAAAKARAERDKVADKPADKSEAETGDKSKEAKAEGVDKPADKTDDEEKPSRAKARIEQLARDRAEERRAREAAEAKAAALEARLERLEAQARGEAPKAPEKSEAKPAGNGKPSPDQFETYEDYIEAFTDWKAERFVEQQTRQARERAELDAEVERQEKVNREFIKKVREASEESWQAVDKRLKSMLPSSAVMPDPQTGQRHIGPDNVLADAILRSPNPVALMSYLTEHEDEVVDILRSANASELGLKVGRIEAKLADLGPPPTPTGVSKAPPPVRPVASTPVGGEPDMTGDMDFDTFYRKAASRKR